MIPNNDIRDRFIAMTMIVVVYGDIGRDGTDGMAMRQMCDI